MIPKIYADFHNADSKGRVRLNCVGTTEDLAIQQLELREGLNLILYADDEDENGLEDEMFVEGVVSFSEEEHCWVAEIDWSAIKRKSNDSQTALVNGSERFDDDSTTTHRPQEKRPA